MPSAAEFHLQGEQTLVVSRALLENVNAVLAAVDRGSTLTKVLYSADSEDAQSIVLHFALFRNKHFASAVQFLKEKLQGTQLEGKKLHVTGVGANLHGDVIKAELGVDLEFIDESYSQVAGFLFLLKHHPVASICSHLPSTDDPEYTFVQRGETMQRYRDITKASLLSRDVGEKLPCLYGIFGSAAGIVLVNEDGSIVVKHRHLLAGKSFLGLCQILIGTSDYDEIMALAAAGKRGNIDTQVRDILADDPKSPYGRMPATLPFFPFGKAVDFDKSLADVRREDLAHSLVSSFVVNFFHVMYSVANYERIRNIFIGGNFFSHRVPKLEVSRLLKVMDMTNTLRVNFIKTGHTAALGAMLGSQQDAIDFFAEMKIK